MSGKELHFSDEGRFEVGSDDPLYRLLKPSRKAMDRLEEMERRQAEAWARIRHIPLGGPHDNP